MATTISKIKMNVKPFTVFNLPNVKVDLILRDQKDALITTKSGSEIFIPSEYSGLVPMGNPPAFFGGYFMEGGIIYMSVFRSVDAAVHLSASGSADLAKNPTTILASIENELTNFLNSSKETNDMVDLNLSLDSVQPNIEILKEYKGLDSIIYSIFTRNKIVLLGSYQDAFAFVMGILEYIPDQFKRYMGFTFNVPFIPNRSIVFAAIDDISGFDFQEELSNYELIESAIVDLKQKEAFGNYSSSATRKIAKIINDGGDPTEVYQIVNEIVENAEKSQDYTDPVVFANRTGVEFDDADLIFAMNDAEKSIGGN